VYARVWGSTKGSPIEAPAVGFRNILLGKRIIPTFIDSSLIKLTIIIIEFLSI